MEETTSSEGLITEAIEVPAVDIGTQAETQTALAEPAKPDQAGFFWGTGRRKAAVARVRVRPAKDGKKGNYLINGKRIKEYFSEIRDQNDVMAPLEVSALAGRVDVYVNVSGGGYMGQAGAIKLGLARALKGYDPTLEAGLRDNDFLTRDSRRVERKKYGQPGARRRFQFSKR